MGRRITGAMPQVRLHKATKQALVRINGRAVYLGRFGSPDANARYVELMIEHGFLPGAPRADRPTPPPVQPEPAPEPEPTRMPAANEPVPVGITVGEVAHMYLDHIEATLPAGRRSSKYEKALTATRAVRPLATMPAAAFGTRALLDVRQRLVLTPAAHRKPDATGRVPTLSRRYVNEVVGYVRRMFDWAVLHELVPNDRVAALAVVKPLRAGDTLARETKRRKRVPVAVVEATLPYLTKEVAGLVSFIRLTGCRPSEAARLRLCRVLDRHKRVWRYVPTKHKTAHMGKQRHIAIGPAAQAIILAHTEGQSDRDYVFSPQRSVPPRKPKDGVIPIEPRRPTAHAGTMFKKDGIRQAIRRAVERANKDRAKKGEPLLPLWTPYQLRYLRLQEIRRRGGSEAAQAIAGHSKLAMTDHYAPPNWSKAARAALQNG